MSLKQIQSILNESDFQPKFIQKWEAIVTDYAKWKTHLSNKEKQLYWKKVHNAIFTEYRLSLMGRSDGKCHFCRTKMEYLTHLFYECSVIKNFLQNLQM